MLEMTGRIIYNEIRQEAIAAQAEESPGSTGQDAG
jgi:hypothetical protein